MVKIVERTQRERDLEKQINTILKITEGIAGKELDIVANNYIHIKEPKSFSKHLPINISISDRTIRLSNQNYFDLAFRLATAYEEQTGNKWTLKKEYDD